MQHIAGRLAVEMQRDPQRHAFKQQIDLEGRLLWAGMQRVVFAGDHRGWREHAAVAQTRNLILEVSCHHVTDFAQGIRQLRTNSIQFQFHTKHPGGHQHCRLLLTTNADYPAQFPCQSYYRCNVKMRSQRNLRSAQLASEHNFEDFAGCKFQERKPVPMLLVVERGISGVHACFRCGNVEPGVAVPF